MTDWGALIARARGLGTHLLDRAALDSLQRAPDLGALGAALAGLGFPVADGERDPAALSVAARRRAAAALAVVERWCGGRRDVLTIIFDDEDRSSLRALLRGAAEHASAEQRLAGLIPTPRLPERALGELARQPGAAQIAVLLTTWGHPFGPPLATAAAGAFPDPLHLETALARAFAARALAGAARDGRGGEAAAYVTETIDLDNAVTAIALAGAEDVTAKDCFVAGGRRVGVERFERAASAPDRVAAAARLAPAFEGTPFAAILSRTPPLALERALLDARIARLRAASRRRPLSLAPVFHFALRLRAQTLDVSRAVWARALGAPPDRVAAPAGA